MKKITLFTLSLIASTSFADDTEIFLDQNSDVAGNALIVLDTSRSMSRWEVVNLGSYDSHRIYPIPVNGFDPTLYYFGNALTNGNGSSDTETFAIKKNVFLPEALTCKNAINALKVDTDPAAPKYPGIYKSKFIRWDGDDWDLIALRDGSMNPNHYMECIEDDSHHGRNTSDNNKWLATWDDKPWAPHEHESDGFWNSARRAWRKTERAALKAGASTVGYTPYVFSGNYLNYEIYKSNNSEPSQMSRMAITREAIESALKSVGNINIGIMRFDSPRINTFDDGEGGFVDVPVKPIDDARDEIINKMNSYFTWGSTPLVESYTEAGDYFAGKAVNYGLASRSVIPRPDRLINRWPSGLVGLDNSVLFRVDGITTPSVAASRNGNNYKSPITSNCQTKNNIILFSDGDPQEDDQSDSYIRGLLSTATNPIPAGLNTNCGGSAGCGKELAWYLANEDQRPLLKGMQMVNTYTVGGFLAEGQGEVLKEIAEYGNGEYIKANNYEAIRNAFVEILSTVSDKPATFVAPSVSVNSYTNLEHLDELYYSSFQPSLSPKWQGNLKRYKLGFESAKVEDVNNKTAVNESNGLFKQAAQSFWTPEAQAPDGYHVNIGGAASNLTTSRNVFTYLKNDKTAGKISDYPLNSTHLTGPNLGLAPQGSPASYPELPNIIKWAQGIDVHDDDQDGSSTDARLQMEDPLHSQPLVANYRSYEDASGNIIYDNTVFVSTNSGFLHAFSTNTNKINATTPNEQKSITTHEQFAYIPEELLPNIKSYYKETNTLSKVYGLDGKMSLWHKDLNYNNNVLDSSGLVETGEHLLLYVGMRRGGRNYYALDVANRSEPKFKWQINGGLGDFTELGQTWSKMTKSKVFFDGTHRDVLFFGGGYDPQEEQHQTRGDASQGRAIFMVDAETGERLWWASKTGADLNLSDMNNSIVADIIPVDNNGDGLADSLYTADTGGRVWRFSLNSAHKDKDQDTFASAVVVADINGGTATTHRRFYTTPDVALFNRDLIDPSSKKVIGNEDYYTISIGSGFRAHPLNVGVEDFFYVISDKVNLSFGTLLTTPSIISHAQLADYNSTSTSVDFSKGFKIPLTGTSGGNGRKSLTTANTSGGEIRFTTYTPEDKTDPEVCDGEIGSAHLYTITPGANTSKKPKVNTIDLKQSGIAPSPQVLTIKAPKGSADDTCTGTSCPPPKPCDDGRKKIILVGTETVSEGDSICPAVHVKYWREL